MKCESITISTLKDRSRYKQLELNPPYQRRPVWKTKDRKLLIASIFSGIPLPAVIFHSHFDKRKNKMIYDVLDGKQRIETILHFIEMLSIEGEGDWEIKVKKNDEEILNVTYSDLRSNKFNKENNKIADQFWNYEIPVIEYQDELNDFFGHSVPTMDVFVRINSTGSKLTKNEIRHAANCTSFFKLCNELENQYKHRFQISWQIFSETEIKRYQFHEFLLELCTAIYFQKYTDKRKKLEELLTNHKWTAPEIRKLRNRFAQVIKWMRSIFRDELFRNTRFKNKSDFYSLFVVLNDLVEKKYVTTNLKNNRILGNTLVEFSKAAQEISANLKKYDLTKSWKAYDKEIIQYVIATRESTDSLSNRQFRNDFLQKLLKGFVVRKDGKRIFDENIKGVLWTRLLQRFKQPKCPNPGKNPNCEKTLTYNDAQIDHVNPWSKGGSTTLKNAQLICSSCNRRKSAK